MSKDKRKDKDKKNQNQKHQEFKIPEDPKRLAKLTFKKYKKNNKDLYDSKKELKKGYYGQIIDLLPESLQLLVRYGHIPAVQETKEAIYNKITDEGFVKYLIKFVKNDQSFDNMILLPNVIVSIMKEANQRIAEAKEKDPNSTLSYDLSDMVELSHLILKKKIKKITKDGINESVAFDALSIIPDTQILNKSASFHLKELFNMLYVHAKTEHIDFAKLVKHIFKGSKIETVIAFALLERKEKISNFNDSQKELFNDITDWAFKTMEDMKKEDIYAILKAYSETRKRDESQKKDGARRYYISSLPAEDYPKIIRSVEKIIERYPDYKNFF